MEEKLIIQSKRGHVKTILIITCIITLICWTIAIITNVSDWRNGPSNLSIAFYLLGIIGIIPVIILIAIFKEEINVTDKRVYGKAKFGRRVDLPFDSISSVGTGMFKGISVSTSSGRIKFMAISNNKEIHEVISKLLIERQGKEKPVATTTIKQEIPQSNADELMKYKNLFDNGIITQEEFEAKKKQL